MFFNWLVTAWHAIITRFDYDEDLQETLDNWAFLVFLIAYGLFLVVFVSLVLITVRILHTVNVVVKYVIYEVNIDVIRVINHLKNCLYILAMFIIFFQYVLRNNELQSKLKKYEVGNTQCNMNASLSSANCYFCTISCYVCRRRRRNY